MNKVSREAIKHLLELEDNVTLSIYLPTHRFPTSEHISEDRIRFKNLIRAGKEALEAEGVDDGIVGQIVSELDDLYNSETFWQYTTEGLAVFCSAAGVRHFHLPIECDEHVSAGDHYDITPLLAVASCDTTYYLLALAVHHPVLYRGDMYGVERVTIDLPESPEEALRIDELPGVKSHGQGDSRQAGQEERLKFFRIIDEKIHTSGNVDGSLPLLLAGTDDEVSGYRESSELKSMLMVTLSGNYTETAVHEIHARAWLLVNQELCDKERASVIEKVRSLLGTGKASTETEAIAAAASAGRVDTLLVGILTETRDTVSDSEGPTTRLLFSDSYERDGVSSCGRTVFDQGGKVLGAFKDQLPDGASQAAIYRY